MFITTTAQQFDTTVHSHTASVLHVPLTTPQGHQETKKTRRQVSENEGDILQYVFVCNKMKNIVTYLNGNCDMLFQSRFIPLPDNTRHSVETYTHAPGRIPTPSPNKQAVVDAHFGSRRYRNYVNVYRKYHNQNMKISFSAWQLNPH